ncbi:MAG: Aminotransferase [Candidatus Saccharibacteria bacterium]|nr:Aminotransferase [Candidatus Saccharibacteria bacterium]
MKPEPIYFDYAAATPLEPAVLEAMLPYLSSQFYNPSAQYSAALSVKADLLAAREKVAHWLGSRPSEIIFTAGGTEANNLAIHGVMRSHPEANMVVSSIEHSAALAPAQHYDVRQAAVQPTGIVDVDSLRAVIDDNTVLVSSMYANNEIGTIQPIKEISQVVATIKAARKRAGNHLPLYLHTDACQAPNYLDLHVARLGVDLMSLNGSKIYGPKQTGVLYVKGGISLMPLIDGGGQERGLRSGTENIAGAIGFATALDLVQQQRHDEVQRMQTLQDLFFKELKQRLPVAVTNGSLSRRLPNNVHITIPGSDNERLLIMLDQRGIMAAAGSACSASSQEASKVLTAIGLSEAAARSSLRFTMGRHTTQAHVHAAVETLLAVLA